MRFLFLIFMVINIARASAADPNITDIVQEATHSLSYTLEELTGPGAEIIKNNSADAQFVFVGENHFDRETPVFIQALYDMLREDYGFNTLVVENDPLAMEAVSKIGDDLERIAALEKSYPTHIGFQSDQDLKLYAHAAGVGNLWGIEQAQGAARYLEELVTLAKNDAARARASDLFATAQRLEKRSTIGAFMHDDPETLGALKALQDEFQAKPGSRADRLLTGLIKSAEIYSYNRRANEGEYVGLYNNTAREALFRDEFLYYYNKSPKRRPVKALFKMGMWHAYRGKSPGQAFTINNFIYELAIANGRKAYNFGIFPRGGRHDKLPEWLAPVLPEETPGTPLLIDLNALKPYARLLSRQLEAKHRNAFLDYVHGFDALVIIPNSADATFELTAMPD